MEKKRKKRRRKKRGMPVALKLLITVACVAIILIIIIALDGDKKEAPAESSAPAAESTAEYDVVVKPDGSFKAVDENADKIGLFVVEHLRPALSEVFENDYTITEYSNDVVVATWHGIDTQDIDDVRSGDKESISGWEDCKKEIMDASHNMTFALQGYVPGSHVAIVLVDPRNHEDVLLVVNDGYLNYDFDLDGDMDPWLIYSNYNEEVKDRKPNL